MIGETGEREDGEILAEEERAMGRVMGICIVRGDESVKWLRDFSADAFGNLV